ncbi:MAG TPA: CHAD domain-containing protein [Thermoleophilaceae bacterium]|nr:CHAD domain-containing protein [Thermoleophilaceae bacterium]
MRARRVKGLDAGMAFREAVERVIAVRAAEVDGFREAARDPGDVDALHDMRIAAKRLRYAYEIAEPCLGAEAKRGARRARALQDLLGEIHDCDELVPLVRRHRKRLRDLDVAAIREGRPPPHRTSYRGLATLESELMAKRDLLYARFLEEW